MHFTVEDKLKFVNICKFQVNFRRVYKCFINISDMLLKTYIRINYQSEIYVLIG